MFREQLRGLVPMPENELVLYPDQDPAWVGNQALAAAREELTVGLEVLMKPAKK
jgi:hypothetical protein